MNRSTKLNIYIDIQKIFLLKNYSKASKLQKIEDFHSKFSIIVKVGGLLPSCESFRRTVSIFLVKLGSIWPFEPLDPGTHRAGGRSGTYGQKKVKARVKKRELCTHKWTANPKRFWHY